MKILQNIIIVAFLLVFFGPLVIKKTCRSHDSFMFLCRHDDTNTDIYLRRISEKLDKIYEQIDKTSDGEKEYKAIFDAKRKTK